MTSVRVLEDVSSEMEKRNVSKPHGWSQAAPVSLSEMKETGVRLRGSHFERIGIGFRKLTRTRYQIGSRNRNRIPKSESESESDPEIGYVIGIGIGIGKNEVEKGVVVVVFEALSVEGVEGWCFVRRTSAAGRSATRCCRRCSWSTSWVARGTFPSRRRAQAGWGGRPGIGWGSRTGTWHR